METCVTSIVAKGSLELKEEMGGYIESINADGMTSTRCTAKFQPVIENGKFILRAYTARHCFYGEQYKYLRAHLAIKSEKSQDVKYVRVDVEDELLMHINNFFTTEALTAFTGSDVSMSGASLKYDVFGKRRMMPFEASLAEMQSKGIITSTYGKSKDTYFNQDAGGMMSLVNPRVREYPLIFFKNKAFARIVAQYYATIYDSMSSSPCQSTDPDVRKSHKVVCFFASDLEVMEFTLSKVNEEEILRKILIPSQNSDFGSLQIELSKIRRFAILKSLIDSVDVFLKLWSKTGLSKKEVLTAALEIPEQQQNDFLNSYEASKSLLEKNSKELNHLMESLENYLLFWKNIVDTDQNLIENLILETNIVQKDLEEQMIISGFNSTPFSELITENLPAIITPNGIIFRGQEKIIFESSDSGSIITHKKYGPILALMNVDNKDVSNQGVVQNNPSLADYIKQIEDPPENKKVPDETDKKTKPDQKVANYPPTSEPQNPAIGGGDSPEPKSPSGPIANQKVDQVNPEDGAKPVELPKAPASDDTSNQAVIQDNTQPMVGIEDRLQDPPDILDDEYSRDNYVDPTASNCM